MNDTIEWMLFSAALIIGVIFVSGGVVEDANRHSSADLARQQYELQLRVYQNDVEHYNQWRVQQQQYCSALDYRQVELNRTYDQIKQDNPVTSSVVLDLFKRFEDPNLTDDARRSITSDGVAQCLILKLGSGDCSKVAGDIRYAMEQQRLLNDQVQNGCCEVKTIEAPYSDVGRKFRPQCTMPSPPQPPRPPGP